MLRLKAVNTICRAVKLGEAGDKKKGLAPRSPVTEEIQPGKRFSCTEEEGAFLLKTGAAVRLGAEETYAPQTETTEPTQEPPLSDDDLFESLAQAADRLAEVPASPAGEDDLVG